eukprot:3363887-Rhodomonas_salina.1
MMSWKPLRALHTRALITLLLCCWAEKSSQFAGCPVFGGGRKLESYHKRQTQHRVCALATLSQSRDEDIEAQGIASRIAEPYIDAFARDGVVALRRVLSPEWLSEVEQKNMARLAIDSPLRAVAARVMESS